MSSGEVFSIDMNGCRVIFYIGWIIKDGSLIGFGCFLDNWKFC